MPTRVAVTLLLAAVCLSAGSARAERAFELIKKADFRSAYHQTLGPLKGEKWLGQLPGPASEGSKRTIEGVEYTLADSCKPHDCEEENLVLAYAPSTRKVYVLVRTSGQVRLLGNPPSAVAAELQSAHAERFKS